MTNYVNAQGGQTTYPYSIGQLRRDNPNTSFPKSIPDQTLAAYGIYPVADLEAPSIDAATQKLVQDASPSLVDGQWQIGWSVVSLTAVEIAEKANEAGNAVRSQRDRLLSSCDWTQVADAPVNKTAWAAYRQELRDIPSQAGFPGNVIWPSQPE